MDPHFQSRTSWRAKLEKNQAAKLVLATLPTFKRHGPMKLLIPRPIDVDAVIRRVRKGRLVTVAQIREVLARDFNSQPASARRAVACVDRLSDAKELKASSACPLCTGIFVRIAAEAAEEDRRAGKKRITPYWRVIRDDGTLHEKFPGGPPAQARQLKAEGHHLEPGRGKRPPKVKDFEKSLAKLS